MPEFPPLSDETLEALLRRHARPGACPPPDLLNALREGVLPPEADSPIRVHAGRCPLCQALLESDLPAALDAAADARIRARLQAGLDARGGWRPSRWVWAAAAAVLLLAAGLVIRHRATPPAAPGPPSEVVTIAALAPPDSGPALVTRGAAAPSAAAGPSTADLLPAFEAYNRGDYAQAAAAFTQLQTRFPQAAVPPLYLGVSQLELGRNAAAQRALLRALPLADPAARGAAAWYLAIADVRLGQVPAARPLLRDLCGRSGDAYSAPACRLARQLPPN
jgi:hypothetical protein